MSERIPSSNNLHEMARDAVRVGVATGRIPVPTPWCACRGVKCAVHGAGPLGERRWAVRFVNGVFGRKDEADARATVHKYGGVLVFRDVGEWTEAEVQPEPAARQGGDAR